MSYDSYLDNQTDEYLARQDEQQEAYEELKDYVIEQIKKDEPIIYGDKYRQTTADNCDLSDKLAKFQSQLLKAYLTGDKETIVKVVNQCCSEEIESLIDLIGY